jgi:L-histidine N-alpha-methyltransferase
MNRAARVARILQHRFAAPLAGWIAEERMDSQPAALTIANDAAPALAASAAEIIAGLTAPQKRLSPKYFYDERGSELFDRICELPEYYLTRTELKLMHAHGPELAALVGPRASVIELGAGSSVKARLLLNHLIDPTAYVAVDISPEYLLRQALELAADYPDVHIQPVFADFTQPFALPSHPVTPERNLVFFPGSTIGNFSRTHAFELLEVMAGEAKPGGAAVIGVDLRKDRALLEAAYNDSEGVTAEFNLNVLARLNRELEADFELDSFEHSAVYDEAAGRIEMRLVSTRAQTAHVAGVPIRFAPGEYIITEHSHKYSVDEFTQMAARAGFTPDRVWIDDRRLFSVHYLTVQ